MNEYTITLTIDGPEVPPSTIVLNQTTVDKLLNDFALPAAVMGSSNRERTVTLGSIEVSNEADPVWNGEKVEQEVFANMLGDAMILAAIKYGREVIGDKENPESQATADN